MTNLQKLIVLGLSVSLVVLRLILYLQLIRILNNLQLFVMIVVISLSVITISDASEKHSRGRVVCCSTIATF